MHTDTTAADGTRTLRFTAAEVPCDEGDLLWSLRVRLQRQPDDPWDAAAILADAPTEMEALHRYLIAAKRARGRYDPLRSDLEDCLRSVRPHTTLYTPRDCGCLRRAWAAFTAAIDTALVDAEDTVYGCQATQSTNLYDDLTRPRHAHNVLAYAGWEYADGRRVPRRVEVSVAPAAARIDLTFGAGRNVQRWAFTPLSGDVLKVRARVSWSKDRGHLGWVGGWLATWPPPLFAVLQAWTGPRSSCGFEDAHAIYTAAAGDAGTDEATCAVAATVAAAFPGTIEELFAAAAAIAADTRSRARGAAEAVA